MKKPAELLKPDLEEKHTDFSPDGEFVDLETLPITPAVDDTRAIVEIWKPFIFGWDGRSNRASAKWFSKIYDLLHDLDELADLFGYAMKQNDWLNAYLLAAGMNQVVEDYLHPDPFFLNKAAAFLEKQQYPATRVLAEGIKVAAQVMIHLKGIATGYRAVQILQNRVAKIVNQLAEGVIDPTLAKSRIAPKLIQESEVLLTMISAFPADLRGQILRLPSCFRSFDQQPDDLRRIADEFSSHWPEKDRQITVIGIRTSGSYLAPLYTAILKRAGYSHVKMLTLRPNSLLNSDDQAALRHLVHRDSLALVCDDPPNTGSTLLKTAAILRQAGLPAANIILLLQLFDHGDSFPKSLQGFPSVLMSWQDWSVNQLLESQEVCKVLSEACLPSVTVTNVEKIPDAAGKDNRHHAASLYRVGLLECETQRPVYRMVRVSSPGLGYFGEHTLAVAQRLADYSARIITYHRGLVYQEVPEPAQPLTTSQLITDDRWMHRLAVYILERNRQLPTGEDTGLKLNGRNAVWEVASTLLSRSFGRGWWLVRMPLVDPYVKNLLKARRPSVIDGEMNLPGWFINEMRTRSIFKLDLAERDFSHLDLYSYDPVYDLAAAAVEIGNEAAASSFRKYYESLTGHSIPPETWLTYQLVHLWDQERQDERSLSIYRRQMSQRMQNYFEEIFFDGLDIPKSGPLCAVDIDGVLETDLLGFAALTAKGAASLRALASHGYRTLLATGRSLAEVKDRCRAYHLPGGIAEYGAVAYDHLAGQEQLLLKDSDLESLCTLRKRLTEMEGIDLDPMYQFSIRAVRRVQNGQAHGLDQDEITRVLNEAGLMDKVYAIPGKSQTDFMVNGVNKGTGLGAWLSREVNEHRLAFAVGDSDSDLPMLSLADRPFAPANASQPVKNAGVRVTGRPYQSGLYQAVSDFLGHQPGQCPTCRTSDLSAETNYFLDILAAQENGSASMILQAGKLLLRQKGI